MKLPNIQDKLVVVNWHDVTMNEEWITPTEAMEEKIPLIRSVGWVLEITNEFLRTVSWTCSDGTLSYVNLIPFSLVKDITLAGTGKTVYVKKD